MTTAEERQDSRRDGGGREERREGRREQRRERTQKRQERTEERQEQTEVIDRAAGQRLDIIARSTDRGLHIAEDLIYALIGLLLVTGAAVVVVHAVFEFVTGVSDGVVKAVEQSLSSLLIVFILVELLSAVRTIITEHQLVAEPFLIVGILAAIKELVSTATFTIDQGKVSDTMLKIGGLGAVVVGLCVAILILRHGRGGSETGDTETSGPASQKDDEEDEGDTERDGKGATEGAT